MALIKLVSARISIGEVMKALKAAGLPAKRTPDVNHDIEDEEVIVSKRVYVQVGSGYAVVNIWSKDEDEVESLAERSKVSDIVNDVKKALLKTKEKV